MLGKLKSIKNNLIDNLNENIAALEKIALDQQKEIERLKDDKNRLEKMMDNLRKELDAEKIKNF